MHVCTVYVYMYVCMFGCKSFILQTSVIKLFPWQHDPFGTFYTYSLSLSSFSSWNHGLFTQEEYMRLNRRFYKSSLIVMTTMITFLLSLKLFRCENKQFLKIIMVYLYVHTNHRKCALKTRTLFMEKIMNKLSGT